MSVELYDFIKSLIDEINNLQQSVDGEFSGDFEKTDKLREEKISFLLAELEKFK